MVLWQEAPPPVPVVCCGVMTSRSHHVGAPFTRLAFSSPYDAFAAGWQAAYTPLFHLVAERASAAPLLLQAKARKAVVRQARQAVDALTRPQELDTIQVGPGRARNTTMLWFVPGPPLMRGALWGDVHHHTVLQCLLCTQLWSTLCCACASCITCCPLAVVCGNLSTQACVKHVQFPCSTC